MRRLIPIAATVLLVSLSVLAQPAPPPPATTGWCATSPARTDALRERHEWRSSRRIGIRSHHPDRVIERDGVFVVEVNDSILVNDDPLDLIGRSIRIRPSGTGYAVETLPIDYRDEVGELVSDFGASSESHRRLELAFSFPFHGSDYDHIYVTNRNGIHFQRPVPSVLNQYEAFDAAAIDEPLISPLLISKTPRTFVSPALFANVTSDEIVLTWRTDSVDFAYDVQTVLSRDGSITMSWRSTRDVTWGAVVVTPGISSAEMSRQGVAAIDDAVEDVSGARADQDLEGLEIRRFDGSDLLEIRVDLRGFLQPGAIAPGEYVQYGIDTAAANTSRIVVHLTTDQKWLLLPGRGWISDPGSLRLEGRTIRFLLNDRDLESGDPVQLSAWVFDSAKGMTIDTAYGPFTHAYSSDSFELDLSESGGTIQRPIVESFTLPDMDPYAVWDIVSRNYSVDPTDTDALAIYQDFFTDLVLYAGAYSTVGNPGVDGVASRSGYGRDSSLFPALLHMSKLGYRYNTTDELSTHVLNHEFGHRWLYFFEITEDGESKHSLNPAGGHPAQFVHTPAAFDVRGSRNSSAMGGSWFEDRGNGTFRASTEPGAYGYSWHELYLMGLADPDEVEPWFYIDESSPGLGDAYYPPAGIVVSGVRKNVSIDQVIESMGARMPGQERSRKRFSTYFVLLVRDLETLDDEKVDDLHYRRRLLEEAIPLATGGRASIKTIFDHGVPRRRGVRRP